MKAKQLKIKYYLGTEFKDYITIGESIVTRIYETLSKAEFEDKEKLNWLVKVAIPEEEANEYMLKGVTLENKEYIFFMITPGMQKKEQKIDGINYKLECLFIKKELSKFRHIVENILSGDKINKYRSENKEMCIVKDITARLALGLTDTHKIDIKEARPEKPRAYSIIVDEATYTYAHNYSYLEKEKDEIVNTTEPKEKKYTLNDGGGLMSDEMAQVIADQMGVNYRVDFAIVRAYKGMAVKGVLLRYNFAKYITENFQENKEWGKKKDETFKFGIKKENDIVYIKDIFGVQHDVNKIDIIYNKSMTKWAKNWTSMEELEVEYNKECYDKVRDLLDCLYVTKINKDPKKLKTHKKVNYQLLLNTMATGKDLIEMATPDINYYKKIVELRDVDYIRLFLGEYIDDIKEDIKEDEENNNEEVKENEYEIKYTQKLNYFLAKKGDKALKYRWVKRSINRMIRKKIYGVAGGQFNMEGSYNVIALDPISYCNYLLTGSTGENGLGVDEFYIAGKEGKEAVMYRNPIACYWEVRKITLKEQCEELKDYTPELIFFNGKDNTLFLLSGADVDGDAVGLVYNNTLSNCVVEEEYPFVNIEDGEQGDPHILNDENMINDIITSSGNLIGKIAINNAKLNVICNSIDNIAEQYITEDKTIRYKAYTYKQYQSKFITGKGLDESTLTDEQKKSIQDEFKKYKKDKEKSRDIKKLEEFDNDDKRCFIEALLKKHKEEFSYILLASQQSIDMPKTLKPVDKEVMDKFSYLNVFKKPIFMHYLGKCDCEGKKALNQCESIVTWGKAKWVENEVVKGKEKVKKMIIENIKKKSNSMDILVAHVGKELMKYMIEDLNISGLDDAKMVVNDMYVETLDSKTEPNQELINICAEYKKARENAYKMDNEAQDKLDFDTQEKIQALNLDDSTIVSSLKASYKPSIRFALLFFFDLYDRRLIMKNHEDAAIFVKDKKGDFDWLYNNYRKEIAKETNLVQKTINEDIKRKAGVIKVKVGGAKEEIAGELSIKLDTYTDKEGNSQLAYKIAQDKVIKGFIYKDHVDKVNSEIKYNIVKCTKIKSYLELELIAI